MNPAEYWMDESDKASCYSEKKEKKVAKWGRSKKIFKNKCIKNKIKITGGGLPGEFQLAQLHFHWGSADQHGAEHVIKGVI